MTATAARGSSIPLRVGPPEAFAAVRACLLRAGYGEGEVCARTGAPSMYDFKSIREGRQRTEIVDVLDLLVRLFLDSEPVESSTASRLLTSDEAAAFESLGLVRRDEDGVTLEATVLLYPTCGLHIVSDVGGSAAVAQGRMADDVVYPAITENTGYFVRALPVTPAARFLELCGGTGIAALIAARGAPAGHAWTADITERATRCADFNARLNGLSNVTAVQGDLYEAVRGLTFDRIVAHPPYVATDRPQFIYRDGGPDGEEITRGVLAGLPPHLAPGGRFFGTCVATDRKDMPLEQRIRRMLGEAEGEFDVVLAVRVMHHPLEYYCSLASHGFMTFARAEEHIQRCRGAGIERLVYTSMAIERHAEPREPVTQRRWYGQARVGAALEWALDWNRFQTAPDLAERLLDARIRAVPGAEVRVTQKLADGEWQVVHCSMTSDVPFRTEIACSPAAAQVVARCDGTASLREVIRRLVEEGLLAEEGAEESIVAIVRQFIDAGCLSSEAIPAPDRDP